MSPSNVPLMSPNVPQDQHTKFDTSYSAQGSAPPIAAADGWSASASEGGSSQVGTWKHLQWSAAGGGWSQNAGATSNISHTVSDNSYTFDNAWGSGTARTSGPGKGVGSLKWASGQ